MSEGRSAYGKGPEAGVERARRVRPRRLRLTGTEVRLAVLLILVAVFAASSPFFLTPLNLSNILLAASVVGVVACAQTLLLVAGQVDISIGSAVAFASAVFAVTAPSYGIPVAIVACVAAALVVSAVNIMGIVHFRVSSIIVTLATFIMFRGIARIVLEGRAIQVRDFGFLGQTKVGVLGIEIHLTILVLLMVAIFFWVLMRETQYGQHMYAIGANSRAARLAGISLERGIVVGFILSGLTVAVASLLLTSQTGVVDPTTGERLEFLALTGVMIGGASLHGGRGSVSGTLMAILILAVFDNGLILMQVPSFYQEVFRGALLLGAVIFDEVQRRKSGSEDDHLMGATSAQPSPDRASSTTGSVPAPLLRVENLRKEYGAIVALEGVSFAVVEGEVVGLLGDNGAGKSTLVNMLSGAVTPTSGRIVFGGRERSFSSPADARAAGIETVYQQLALVEMFDIATNFYLGREAKRPGALGRLGFLDRPRMRRRAWDAVAKLPTHFPDLGAAIGTMSGGQRQAVAIARASFWGGHLLLLDEPTAALGVKEAAGVLDMITHLVSESRMSMIVISHNIEHVWSVCHRMLVLRQGRLVADVRKEETSKSGIVAHITGAA